ncbi:MAG: DUF1461 domain-containing protein [Chloroflexota bacterium]|nr:DUF1461 domain-containing protein [Chloroflexota bacterium]
MSRAPRLVGFVFAVAAAIIIALAGPLLLFDPWFVSFEQRRNDVAPALGVDQAAVDRVTGTILIDLVARGDFDVSLDGRQPLLDAMERSHMRDVSGLVRILVAVLGAAIALFALTGAWLREARRRGRLLVLAAAAIGGVAVVLAMIFAVAFEPAFLAFHTLFFAQGTYLFGTDSQLIKLFPEGFWFESSLVAGATIVLAALVAGLLGWRLMRDRDS